MRERPEVDLETVDWGSDCRAFQPGLSSVRLLDIQQPGSYLEQPLIPPGKYAMKETSKVPRANSLSVPDRCQSASIGLMQKILSLMGLIFLNVLPILSVHAQTTATSATLSWIAPGDDGNVGTAVMYDLRYATNTITSATWANARQVTGEPIPKTAGGAESFTVTGLDPATTYFFAMKSVDKADNWSAMSNVVQRTTLGIVSNVNDYPDPRLPTNGAVVPTTHPTLVVENATTESIASYLFEIATDSFFVGMVETGSRPAGSDGTTSYKVTKSLSAGRTYYWRSHGDTFPYSPRSAFTVQPVPHAYPNPFMASEVGAVTFADLPSGSTLTILAIDGSPVRIWTGTSGQDILWDGRNESGHAVSSGTYLWYLTDSEARGKIIVIR
jgi:hypothetical protein